LTLGRAKLALRLERKKTPLVEDLGGFCVAAITGSARGLLALDLDAYAVRRRADPTAVVAAYGALRANAVATPIRRWLGIGAHLLRADPSGLGTDAARFVAALLSGGANRGAALRADIVGRFADLLGTEPTGLGTDPARLVATDVAYGTNAGATRLSHVVRRFAGQLDAEPIGFGTDAAR
jgi:hypothetical protein